MKHVVVWLLAAAACLAQERGRMMTLVRGDSVYVYMSETPRRGQGYVVERKGPGEADYQRLTPEPLKAMWNALEARQHLGDDYPAVASMLNCQTPLETLLKLRSSAFHGGILSLIYPCVGQVLGRNFASGGHRPGAVYEYRVTRVDLQGRVTDQWDRSVVIRDTPVTPPSEPVCELTPDRVRIRWTYAAWQDGGQDLTVRFRVSRRVNDGAAVVLPALIIRSDAPEFVYEDADVRPGQRLSYSVQAVNAAGQVSEPGPSADIVFEDQIAPASPSELTAQAGNMAVRLAWSASDDIDVAAYRLYRSEGLQEDAATVLRGEFSALAAVDSVEAGGVQYFYSVSAVDSAGNESARSLRVGVLPFDDIPPETPAGFEAVYSSGAVHLSWNPVDAADLKGYRLARGFGPDRTALLADEVLTVTTLTDSGSTARGLMPGATYFYALTAVDREENVSQPAVLSVRVPDAEAPLPPTALFVSNADGRAVSVRWNGSPSLDVTILQLSRQPAWADGPRRFDAAALSFVDSTVTAGTAYQYELAAIDSSGNVSEPLLSEPMMFSDFVRPEAVSGVQAVLTDKGVKISWNVIPGSTVQQYRIYRSSLPTGRFEMLFAAEPGTMVWLDAGGGSRHWYRVAAVNASGLEGAGGRAVRPVKTVPEGIE